MGYSEDLTGATVFSILTCSFCFDFKFGFSFAMGWVFRWACHIITSCVPRW